MKPFSIILAANEVREVGVSGTIFELRTAPHVVERIELLDANRSPVGIMEEAEATDKERLPVAFHHVIITNGPDAQTIRFYYGNGDAGSNRFTGVVSGEVDLSPATLATIDLMLIEALEEARLPYEHTGFFSNAAALVANTPLTVFTPAANVNGALLISAFASTLENVAMNQVFIAKASAPADTLDGAVYMQAAVGGIDGSGQVIRGQIETPQFIPAGLGLYFISQTAVAVGTGAKRYCRYRLL